MKGKKQHLTQKRIALSLGLTIVLLFLFLCLCGWFNPFPRSVTEDAEIRNGTGPTELIQKEIFYHQPYYLTGNENALILSTSRFHLIGGWQADGWCALDLSREGGPIFIDNFTASPHSNATEHTQLYFGQVEAEGAAAVRISYPYGNTDAVLEIPLSQGEDGRTYFWGWHTVLHEDSYYMTYPQRVEALDGNGAVLCSTLYGGAYGPTI